MLKRIKHYVARSYALGPRRTWQAVTNKIGNASRDFYWRKMAMNRMAHATWQSMGKKYPNHDFDDFFSKIAQQKPPPFPSDFFVTHEDDQSLLIEADLFSNKCFTLLGSKKCCFAAISWHEDFRADQSEDRFFDSAQYYKDYEIQSNNDITLGKDIKVPWELSRFNYIFVMGRAYQVSGDVKYANTFVDHIQDWMDKNPFLFGPNWVCPMEVAIRAINWQWGFYFFRNSKDISVDFWQRFFCALYDHMIYLEHNWEIYDSLTSNHYVSDLVGYFYLSYLFQDLSGMREKTTWCHNELIKEWEKQINADGTSYEGSTAYHALVTEIFYHVSILAKAHNFDNAHQWHERLKSMLQFIEQCTPRGGKLVKIGDDDSGYICYPRLKGLLKDSDAINPAFYYYPDFGLSVLKAPSLHCTVRHHAYRALQPSGHFHNDVGSITLFYEGIEILADPGSYVYSASSFWRNSFRSFQMHNTFYRSDGAPIFLDEKLFFLAIPEHHKPGLQVACDNKYRVHTTHCLYESSHELYAHRLVTINEVSQEVVITDWWEYVGSRSTKEKNNIPTTWNFMLGSSIAVENNENCISLKNQEKYIATIKTVGSVVISDAWVAPSYGIKIPCKKLSWQAILEPDQKLITTISFTIKS